MILFEDIVKQIITESRAEDNARKLIKAKYPSMSRESRENIFNTIRQQFPMLRNGDSKRYIYGITRMYLNGELSDANTIMRVDKTLSYLDANPDIAKDVPASLNDWTAQDFIQQFQANVQQSSAEANERMNNMQEEDKGYDIVQIYTQNDAAQYADYCDWCITYSEYNWREYTDHGNNTFYFCLKKGFENVERKVGEGCPNDEYGLSMIAVNVDSEGNLATSTCRWNHDKGAGDHQFTEEEISNIIGKKFYDAFPPDPHPCETWQTTETLSTGYQVQYDSGMDRYRMLDPEGEVVYFDGDYEDAEYIDTFEDGFAEMSTDYSANIINEKGECLYVGDARIHQLDRYKTTTGDMWWVARMDGGNTILYPDGKLMNFLSTYITTGKRNQRDDIDYVGVRKSNIKMQTFNISKREFIPGEYDDLFWAGVDQVTQEAHGIVVIDKNKTIQLFDKGGKILDTGCSDISTMHNGVIQGKFGDKCTWLNSDGKPIFPGVFYEQVDYFYNGYARIKLGQGKYTIASEKDGLPIFGGKVYFNEIPSRVDKFGWCIITNMTANYDYNNHLFNVNKGEALFDNEFKNLSIKQRDRYYRIDFRDNQYNDIITAAFYPQKMTFTVNEDTNEISYGEMWLLFRKQRATMAQQKQNESISLRQILIDAGKGNG